MDWNTVVSIILAYAGQWLKSLQRFPTPLAHLTIGAVAIGLYALDHHAGPDFGAWLKEAIMWAFAVLGLSSVAGGIGLAPKTDSK